MPDFEKSSAAVKVVVLVFVKSRIFLSFSESFSRLYNCSPV